MPNNPQFTNPNLSAVGKFDCYSREQGLTLLGHLWSYILWSIWRKDSHRKKKSILNFYYRLLRLRESVSLSVNADGHYEGHAWAFDQHGLERVHQRWHIHTNGQVSLTVTASPFCHIATATHLEENREAAGMFGTRFVSADANTATNPEPSVTSQP